jgi:glycosyltransferase involved in cell wall biosynthesis
MNICIVIPAHNESKTIGPLVGALREKKFDVLVIDDGSTDLTGDLARAQGATVIRQEQKSGKGYALQKGFEHAMRRSYDGVVIMDGDGQHDVDSVERFVALAERNQASVIVGNRMADPRGMPKVRYCTNRLMSWLISLTCGQRIADTQCGYRYIGCDVLKVISLKCRDFEIETEILMKARKKGFPVYDLPIQTIYRNEESKINPFKDTVRFIAYFIKEIFSGRS